MATSTQNQASSAPRRRWSPYLQSATTRCRACVRASHELPAEGLHLPNARIRVGCAAWYPLGLPPAWLATRLISTSNTQLGPPSRPNIWGHLIGSQHVSDGQLSSLLAGWQGGASLPLHRRFPTGMMYRGSSSLGKSRSLLTLSSWNAPTSLWRAIAGSVTAAVRPPFP